MPYTINNKPIGEIGYGLMSLPNLPEDKAVEAIKTAVDSGCNYLNAGEFYGGPDYNSLTILRKFADKYPEAAKKIVVNVKGGFSLTEMRPTATKEDMTKSIENSLAILGPSITIDQYEPARRDANADFVTETLATVDGYVKAGKVGAIALSELGLETFQQAAKAYKISSLEIEFSLFRTEPLTNGLLKACGELDIPVLAYSPLGKGFLTGQIKSLDDIPEGDMRRHYPRFSAENFPKNLELVDKVEALAKKKGCTAGQIAINWVRALSKRPGMPTLIPIPGSANPERIKENAKIVDLSEEDMAEIDSILAGFEPVGNRYPSFLEKFGDL